MGFFDRSSGKPAGQPASPAAESPSVAGGVVPQLATARERLEAKDLPGALALYDQVLAVAGDRADVLVTISGDLGVNGHVAEIVELVAPRYDAERHGPATGLNLLQAYLALREADAAQHVLDILFSLQRPELEERLYGFSNAIAELIQADLPPLEPAAAPGETSAEAPEPAKVNFASISKPIWFYGLEPLAADILPAKGERLRRVAFTQLALMGVPNFAEVARQPENEPSRLTRALPLWLAETFYFSPHYLPIAVVGVLNQKHYAVMDREWTNEHLRQLVDTTAGGLDYIFTGALREAGGNYEVILRLWEVKKFRERKTFTIRWNAATADAELAQLQEQVCVFMEWSPEKSGVSYASPPRPTTWLGLLGSSLSLFFADKQLLPKEQLVLPDGLVEAAAQQAVASPTASLAWLTFSRAARRHGLIADLPSPPLAASPAVAQAEQLLG